MSQEKPSIFRSEPEDLSIPQRVIRLLFTEEAQGDFDNDVVKTRLRTLKDFQLERKLAYRVISPTRTAIILLLISLSVLVGVNRDRIISAASGAGTANSGKKSPGKKTDKEEISCDIADGAGVR